jgi:lysophospholipase L1-like esterase
VRPRLLSLTALAGGALAALALAPAAHAASGDNYVALGDSYSSGVGAGSYTSESGSCDRSLSAYPALWANANSVSSFTFAACSGATTADVANSQLGGLNSATSLVSITIGGNDENFSSIMEDCNLYSDSTCVSEIQAAEDDARANLPGKLASLFGQISARAPYARVVVLDYPHFYDLANDCVGLSQTKRTKIDEGIDVLDAILQNSAGSAGFGFADVRGAFTGHEICDSNRWLHSVNFSDFGESYHPTADGHSQAYEPTFAAAAG